MIFIDTLRVWFIILYVLNLISFIILAVRFHQRRPVIERKKGPLPTPGSLISWGIPLFFLVVQIGELPENVLQLRILGIALSIYHIVMNTWSLIVMGKQFVPGSGVFQEQKLVTSGPFSLIRHPIYSAHIALWLGASLGMLNWILLGLWPLYVALIFFVPVQAEEKLLKRKFGRAYEIYSKKTGKLFPKIW
jgi:protein-S-isoprenylcysteine O-methyltransferase Ste14